MNYFTLILISLLCVCCCGIEDEVHYLVGEWKGNTKNIRILDSDTVYNDSKPVGYLFLSNNAGKVEFININTMDIIWNTNITTDGRELLLLTINNQSSSIPFTTYEYYLNRKTDNQVNLYIGRSSMINGFNQKVITDITLHKQ